MNISYDKNEELSQIANSYRKTRKKTKISVDKKRNYGKVRT